VAILFTAPARHSSEDAQNLEAGFHIEHSFNPAFPCCIEIHARKVGQNIEAVWIASKTKEAAAIGEVLRANAFERCAKPGKRRIGCLSVRRVCFYENVDVLREAWLGVKDYGVSVNDRDLSPWAWKADKADKRSL
jgi:hypothetical protein